ncbi:hypothetical protein BDQ12DRAFT_690963 [Crucibulum laeve]|uniref:Uncharacterized protein n=1 Tax=Crucibulum laeve TaxID=68775 RepID=A0A5C3LNH9_9AGAR|nr:hypothetical protein BDQ12DRAFT_690963 [Crucibulum laeve]
MAGAEGLFMSIAIVHGPNSKSFEEVRIDDYIKAYTTTGQPPVPCPQLPEGDAERQALVLPPLFKPYTVASVSGEAPAATHHRIVDPSEIPPAQAFHMTIADGESYQSISCMSGLTGFSHEELRYYAYLKGHKMPPTPVPLYPFDSTATPVAAEAAPPGGKVDILENISAQDLYAKHCPEELRIAYMLAGRELNSEEIIQFKNPLLPSPSDPPAPTNPLITTTTMPPPQTPRPTILTASGLSGTTPFQQPPSAIRTFQF